ncbi:MAG: ABC transporter ATP-binding protein, partial [Bacteroidota bacterium]
DLVLSGMFERVFKSNAFEFDKYSGGFKIVHPIKGKVSLSGNDVHSVWTRRALEREGYQVIQDSSHPIDILYKKDHWKLKIRNKNFQCQCVGELLEVLRKESTLSNR